MSDYIELKRAELALGSMSMLDGKIFAEDALAKIADLPTIDIVHCKDCIRFDGEDCCERIGMILYPEDIERHFCGYGERKDNE